MQKLVYLVWSPAHTRRDAFADLLLERCGEELLAQRPLGLTLHLKDSDANVAAPSNGMTGREPPSGLVSLWLRDAADREPYESIVRAYAAQYAGYLVQESVYRDHGDNENGGPRDWPDGERSRGVTAVALLERPERMTQEAWIQHWHGSFSPLSESLLSRTRYVRNVVTRTITRDAPLYAGIVEESFPSRKHVSDPYLFYKAASLNELGARMSKLLLGVTQFLDVPRVQTVIFSEYMLKTVRAARS